MLQIYVARAVTVKIRGHVTYHVILTWVIHIGYVDYHAGSTWEALRAGPGTQLSHLRAKERRLHATARQGGCAAGGISAVRAEFPFKPTSVTNPMHISSANLTPSATPATPSDATYTMPKL